MIWKATGNLHRNAVTPPSTYTSPLITETMSVDSSMSTNSYTYYSSQYATTTPNMFRVNSMAMNWPREVCSAVSVAQTGTMAFKMPVPKPLKTRAGICQLMYIAVASAFSPHIIQLWFCAEVCKAAPTIVQAAPTAMVLIRPILSPIQPPKRAPKRHPR
jgi:hypothetical protein